MKVLRHDGSELKQGELIKDFRGLDWRYIGVTSYNKIHVQSLVPEGSFSEREFFPSVFKLEIKDDDAK
jgi:hypothetical protein